MFQIELSDSKVIGNANSIKVSSKKDINDSGDNNRNRRF